MHVGDLCICVTFCAVCVQVTQLSSKGELPGRLTATPGAKLRPDVDEYLVKHGVMAALNEIVTALIAEMPADPIAFMGDKLAAKGGSSGAFKTVSDVRTAFVDYFTKQAGCDAQHAFPLPVHSLGG